MMPPLVETVRKLQADAAAARDEARAAADAASRRWMTAVGVAAAAGAVALVAAVLALV
jgi:hypothetical protein